MNDTICAIATKLGVGAISIIRLSGEDAILKVNQIFSGKDLTQVQSHTIHYGFIKKENEILDEVLVTVMKAPKTFTREDVVEINCHGGILPTKKVLELLLENGVRLAEPGEFTKRAFLNGRIDLTQAESIMELIESKTEAERKTAISSLRGSTKKLIHDFREKLKKIIASIEVNIDYPEYQDIEEMTEEKLIKLLQELEVHFEKILANSKRRECLKKGIKTVLVGRPNVGKSSLLNALLEEDKAIVTDIAGTTRDVVEGEILLDDIPLLMMDTAGIRKTEDIVEKMGVEKSLQLMQNADLVLAVFDGREELTEEDKEILNALRKEKTILILNKKDEGLLLKNEDFKSFHVVQTSTKEENGLDELKEMIRELFQQEELEENEDEILLNARQIALVEQAKNQLKEIKKALESNVELDMISIDLKEVLETLGMITGESYPDEILETLFANFCVGK